MADDPLAILGGFLSEPTRKVRRVLVALGALGLAVRSFGVRVPEVSLLGTKITVEDGRWLSLGLAVVIFYFVVMFAVYAMSDMHRHSDAITRIARRGPLTPDVSLTYRASRTAALLLLARGLLDVLLPVVVGLVAVMLLRPIR